MVKSIVRQCRHLGARGVFCTRCMGKVDEVKILLLTLEEVRFCGHSLMHGSIFLYEANL